MQRRKASASHRIDLGLAPDTIPEEETSAPPLHRARRDDDADDRDIDAAAATTTTITSPTLSSAAPGAANHPDATRLASASSPRAPSGFPASSSSHVRAASSALPSAYARLDLSSPDASSTTISQVSEAIDGNTTPSRSYASAFFSSSSSSSSSSPPSLSSSPPSLHRATPTFRPSRSRLSHASVNMAGGGATSSSASYHPLTSKPKSHKDSVELNQAESGIFLPSSPSSSAASSSSATFPSVGRGFRLGSPVSHAASAHNGGGGGGGGGPNGLGNSRAARKRAVRTTRLPRRVALLITLAVVVTIVWHMSSGDRKQRLSGFVHDKAGKAWDKAAGVGLGGGHAKSAQAHDDDVAAASPPSAAAEQQQQQQQGSGGGGGGNKGNKARPDSVHIDDDLLSTVRRRPVQHATPGKTTRCTAPKSPVFDYKGTLRKTVQYGIMIDAGSTGSRVHVYKFNFCSQSAELESEVFHAIKGGLSSFGADAKGAAESLRPLMEVAMDSIPASHRHCTPVSVKATAGLRLLGSEQSSNILSEVRRMLTNDYPFPIADGRTSIGEVSKGRGVEIMQGRDEGVYAWITVNYLLGRIGDGASSGKSSQRKQTAAVMDLGGASTQIVFEPLKQSTSQGMRPGEHVYEVKNFGGEDYTLYQNSYLGYGLMQARRSINALAAFTYSFAHPDAVRLGTDTSVAAGGGGVGGGGGGGGAGARLVRRASRGDGPRRANRPQTNKAKAAAAAQKLDHQSTAASVAAASATTVNVWDDTHQIPSPCFAEGSTKRVRVGIPGVKQDVEVTIKGTGGGLEACRRLVQVMMNKDAVCAHPPCSFGGVYQPSLMTSFNNSPIVALSYFYDRLTPLGLGPTFTIDELHEVAEKVCAPPSTWRASFGDVRPATTKAGAGAGAGAASVGEEGETAMELLEDKPELCLDLTFMHALLSLGYELEGTRRVTTVKQLDGMELGWALGAQLAVLEEMGVTCKV